MYDLWTENFILGDFDCAESIEGQRLKVELNVFKKLDGFNYLTDIYEKKHDLREIASLILDAQLNPLKFTIIMYAQVIENIKKDTYADASKLRKAIENIKN